MIAYISQTLHSTSKLLMISYIVIGFWFHWMVFLSFLIVSFSRTLYLFTSFSEILFRNLSHLYIYLSIYIYIYLAFFKNLKIHKIVKFSVILVAMTFVIKKIPKSVKNAANPVFSLCIHLYIYIYLSIYLSNDHIS